MEMQASALLAAALVLFVISTRQWPVWLRAAILLTAVVSLTGAGFLIANKTDHYLFSLASDAWNYRGSIGESAAGIAFNSNEDLTGRHIIPLLDLFFSVSAVLGFVTVIALTPGESVERFVRPLLFSLIGVMVGAGLALALVVVGFGGPIEQRVYAASGADVVVYDGDTLFLGDVSLRLYGAEAPELPQDCIDGGECGEIARSFLEATVRDTLLVCRVHERSSGRIAKALGRPLAACTARTRSGESFDIARRMIVTGHAAVYAPSHPEEYEGLAADPERVDFIGQCWEMPRHSRGDTTALSERVGACAPSSSDNPR